MSETSKQNISVLLHAPNFVPDTQTTLTHWPMVPSFSQLMAPCSSEPCVDNHHLGTIPLASCQASPIIYWWILHLAAIWIVCYWEIISMFQMLLGLETISQIIKSIKSFHFPLNDWSTPNEHGLFGQNHYDCITALLLWPYIKRDFLIHVPVGECLHSSLLHLIGQWSKMNSRCFWQCLPMLHVWLHCSLGSKWTAQALCFTHATPHNTEVLGTLWLRFVIVYYELSVLLYVQSCLLL